MLWTFTNAYKQAIADINKGTYGTHGYNLTLKNGGISLLQTKYISTPVWKEIGRRKAGHRLGEDQGSQRDDEERRPQADRIGAEGTQETAAARPGRRGRLTDMPETV